MRIRVRSLAPLGGLRIQLCCELQHRLQMQLRSGVAMAVGWAGSCSSDSTPSLGTSTCGPKKKKKKEEERKGGWGGRRKKKEKEKKEEESSCED